MEENDISYETTDEKEGGESTPKDTIKKLREELKACQAERQTYLEGWQRAKADFVNARKTEERERTDFSKYAALRVVEDTLEVLDTFDHAFSHKEAWEKVDKNWRIGVESIHSKLEEVLKRHGLSHIAPKTGDRFDPNLHQSVSAVETDTPELDDTIAQVLAKGYLIHEKIIRPAQVNVYHYQEN